MRLNFIGKLLPIWLLEKTLNYIPDWCSITYNKTTLSCRFFEIGEGLFLVYSNETYNKIQEAKLKSKEREKEYQLKKQLKEYNKLKTKFEE